MFLYLVMMTAGMAGVGGDIGTVTPIGGCQTKSECESQNGGAGCCCIIKYETAYTCPAGWFVNGTECQRGTETGADSRGYTRMTFGICAATNNGKKACYESNGTCGGLATSKCIA